MKKQLVIANLGTGNLHSVQKALEHVSSDIDICLSNDANTISCADLLVLPGQGALGTWMQHLKANTDTLAAINKRLQEGPTLGICLGLQALFEYSEENNGTEGLGIIKGQVPHFKNHPAHQSQHASGDKLKIPHMGWNTVSQHAHPLWYGIENNTRFYFVHSYYVDCHEPDAIVGQCEYGNTFTAAIAKGNLFACQFHPEKSADAGLTLLKNFVNWRGETL